ncbi:MAG TPA: 3-isopropylmalate dehydrogenase [Gaiellaceae bacterium]|nr:3-isopropylmalate dehydrogenase [Gaiellaceae bacterium]
MSVRIVCLPGDGIGPEVTAAAVRVLAALPLDATVEEHLFGGAAIDAGLDPLPAETLAACLASDAVLLGAVGGPRWDGAAVRPEQGLMGLRKALDVYANLRPAAQGDVDLVIVRELVGGLYFGARGVRDDGTVFDTLEYHPSQIERVALVAFELARSRGGELCSVDKANVLDTSRLWRRVVTEVGAGYPDVRLRHALVDSAAMELVTSPERFDVIVTENTFGDILSDVAAAVTGGLGLASSASLGDGGPGIFEPVHGSAPDIAGRGVANPTAMLRSLALCLEHALARTDLARSVERAVGNASAAVRTPDLGGTATTNDFTEAVLASLTQEEPWTAPSVAAPSLSRT